MRLLHQKDLRAVWPWVREGLYEIDDKAGAGHAIPEDIYHALKTGKAWLYLLEHEQEHIGFIIFQVEQDPDCNTLFVWKLWAARRGELEMHEAAIFAEVELLAQAIPCKRIRMHSRRKGWAAHGFQCTSHVYERELSDAKG